MAKERKDLIGLKGTVTRRIEVLEAKEQEDGTVDIRVTDGVGNVYWTELDESIDLNH